MEIWTAAPSAAREEAYCAVTSVLVHSIRTVLVYVKLIFQTATGSVRHGPNSSFFAFLRFGCKVYQTKPSVFLVNQVYFLATKQYDKRIMNGCKLMREFVL